MAPDRRLPPANIRLEILTDLVQGAQRGLSQFVASLGHELSLDKASVLLSDQMPEGRIVAMLGYVGQLQGGLSLVLNEESFEVFFKALSGGFMEADLDNPIVVSAAGEMLNMIGGKMAIGLSERGYAMDLTPPQVFQGDTIRQAVLPTNRRFILPYRIVGTGGKFFFTIMALRQADDIENPPPL